MAKLLIKTEGLENRTLELRFGVNHVGRDPESDFPIDHPTVSTSHCELVLSAEGILLRDCDSTNGTFVNGEQIMAVKLKHGASIRLGSVELRYESVPAKTAGPAIRPNDQEMVRPPDKSAGSKDRGMAKRMKPEYSVGSLQSGPVTIQPLVTANPIPPAPTKKSE